MTTPLRHLPVLRQAAELEGIVRRNPLIEKVLARAAELALPGWYLAAGCVFQTVWNVLAGRDPAAGIRDYDLCYHDGSDLSWDAEDAVIRRCAETFADLGVDVEVRNQARVHLWYEDRFGVPCPPYPCSEAAIDSFPATACCIGLRQDTRGRLDVYAPRGVYEAKARRWAREWPRLTVLPWPEAAAAPPAPARPLPG